MTRPMLAAAIALLFASSSEAALQLSVTNLTTDSITFSVTGNLSDPSGDLGQLNSGSLNFLYIEVTGNSSWVIAANTDCTVSGGGVLSDNPIATSGSDPVQAFNSYGDFISLQFDDSFTLGTTTGTGDSVTLTFSGTTFDPSAVSLSNFELYWGDTGTDVPFGIFQSVAAVPEPSSFAAIGAFAALMGAFFVRHRK